MCLFTSKTSRPTLNIGFAFKCSTRATSSITGPLLQFIRIASYNTDWISSEKEHIYGRACLSMSVCVYACPSHIYLYVREIRPNNQTSPSSSLRDFLCWPGDMSFYPEWDEDLSTNFINNNTFSSYKMLMKVKQWLHKVYGIPHQLPGAPHPWKMLVSKSQVSHHWLLRKPHKLHWEIQV